MKYFVFMFVLILASCSTSTVKYPSQFGYWLDRGSSTFPGIYQCVETFKPHKNREC